MDLVLARLWYGSLYCGSDCTPGTEYMNFLHSGNCKFGQPPCAESNTVPVAGRGLIAPALKMRVLGFGTSSARQRFQSCMCWKEAGSQTHKQLEDMLLQVWPLRCSHALPVEFQGFYHHLGPNPGLHCILQTARDISPASRYRYLPNPRSYYGSAVCVYIYKYARICICMGIRLRRILIMSSISNDSPNKHTCCHLPGTGHCHPPSPSE